ncbi:RagB/SusD family nutrient uptake outer membrane protein [Mucilaginibacter sp. OK098]|uniref:RagB/SusD family nutrient uptake outer membrane protein n=1 Tax=Mucilaginibacter sp. OK098 TaxID=1855297 RepID=UPI00090F8291|nr:RagB/SusD family nutrient uptake outer membrane protein [Mucilaginibacter sp. OK098]SHM93317.1 Starch-binding associating with outer membrane [Mucilaginibacter sp. OK098]
MKNNNKFLWLTMIFSVLTMQACKKYLEIQPPKNQLTTDKIFADSASANSAIAGIYVNMYQSLSLNLASGGLTLYPGLSGDEMAQSATDVNISQLFNNQINPNNTINASLWTSAYKFVYDVNACIEGINASPNLPVSVKTNLLAEAKQIRAFLYFNLVNLYGPVPLQRSTDYHVNQSMARFPVDSIYSQIITDVTFAQANLLKNNMAERANFYSATALLAKVQLYRKNYVAAESESSKIIGSGIYSLEPNLNNVFLNSSNETIWKIIPVFPGFATLEGYFFVPSSTTVAPKYPITGQLNNSFETGDQRKVKWTNYRIIKGVSYPYPYKYKVGRTTATITENYSIFRLAEQYLIRAEARTNQNNILGAVADLNVIRTRAGLPNTLASDKASLLLAIEKERQSELFCEWGNRWFDLQRTNRADVVLPAVKPNWNHNSILYPIPINEISRNPNLVQNPGY